MSVNYINKNKILYVTDNDADFRRRMRENPEEAIASFPLAGRRGRSDSPSILGPFTAWGRTPSS